MKNVLFISIAVILFSSCGGSDTGISNDLWGNLFSSRATSDKQIISLSIDGFKARISGTTVNSVLPAGTDITALTPIITYNGANISPKSGETLDFTNPVTYTVTATDGTTSVYTVSINVLSSADMSNANLSVLNVKKGKLQPALNNSITDYLDAPIPFSDSSNPAYNDKQSNSLIADPEILIATMTINGISVENGTEHVFPEIEVGPNPVTITVTAADGISIKTYTLNMYRAIPIFKTGAGSYSGINPLEDGATQRGVNWPTVRFTDNGDGTISDRMTGLMWFKDAKKISTTHNFDNAVLEAQNITGFCGYYDWYLPNINEMRSLMNYGTIGYDYLSTIFNNCSHSEEWWTSTSSPVNPTIDGYTFSMNQFFSSFDSDAKSSNFYVLAVRGNSKFIPKTGQINSHVVSLGDDGDLEKGIVWPNLRFHTNSSGAIIDNMTSLMWLPSPGSTQRTWTNSINFIENTLNPDTLGSNLGYNDWKLPNSNELMTLINYGQSNLSSWLNSQGFTVSGSVSYWTSTTGYISPSTNAFLVNFTDQSLSIYIKGASYNILPVRQARIINY